jgi:hypothetical protein
MFTSVTTAKIQVSPQPLSTTGTGTQTVAQMSAGLSFLFDHVFILTP